jgi:hypothetical protein
VPISSIATKFGVSRHLVYNAITDYGIEHERFTRQSPDEIESAVTATKQSHPNAGEVMVQGHLAAAGIHVQRRKIRSAIHTVDPEGVQERKKKPIKKRTYSVASPNYVWHIDGNHKLVRWRFVVHHGIDGFSRMVVFARCSPNNRAETVYTQFHEAVLRYGRPQRIWTDHGGENVDIWRDMISTQGEEAKPVVVGKSVHNQRIERHNRALNEQVMSVFKREFYQLESEGILDVNNDTDIFCLHYIYLPLINKAVSEFVAAHNCHKVSTERNKTPEQLFWGNIHLSVVHHNPLPEHANQPNIGELMESDLPHATVPDIPNPVSETGLNELQQLVSSLSSAGGMAVYRQVVAFVGQNMLDELLPA